MTDQPDAQCAPLRVRLAAGLTRRGQTLSTAESCTGGLLGGRITDWPGSSAYYLGGVVSYADAVKEKLLGVRAESLELYGAVSGEVAREMSEGVRRLTGSDWSIAVTGVAGPAGGSAAKPVGLVWIAATGPGVNLLREYRFAGDREAVRRQTVEQALLLLTGAVCA
ncbi:MAG: nicotinamide-nucleotide amidohydrolase family protein [Gracilibacteraceae bacterium]|jgi:PncC family amidohydrolase|nr:nicotinamide-nucleotide amidohydrolase family protein [Gracilibacteraceae bacterium]